MDYYNYFYNTVAVFKGCKTPKRKPNYVSQSGSKYWYGNDSNGSYVVRHSDHWSWNDEFVKREIRLHTENIASCFWGIKSTKKHGWCMNISGKVYLCDIKQRKK